MIAGTARAQPTGDAPDAYADPCVAALVERNSGMGLRSRQDFKRNRHVDVPDSAFVDACHAASGDPEEAWGVLLRTYLPPEQAAAAGYPPPVERGPSGVALTLAGMALVYAVLGRPVWAAVVALRRPGILAMSEAALCLLARLALGTLLLAALRLPGTKLLACLGLLLLLARRVRATPRPTAGPVEPASRFARIASGLVNDTASAIPGLLALAVVAVGSWGLLCAGVLLSLPAAWAGIRRGRRALWSAPSVLVTLAAALAGGLGALAWSDPALRRVSTSWGFAPSVAFAAVFACVVGWRWRASTPRPN